MVFLKRVKTFSSNVTLGHSANCISKIKQGPTDTMKNGQDEIPNDTITLEVNRKNNAPKHKFQKSMTDGNRFTLRDTIEASAFGTSMFSVPQNAWAICQCSLCSMILILTHVTIRGR